MQNHAYSAILVLGTKDTEVGREKRTLSGKLLWEQKEKEEVSLLKAEQFLHSICK